MIKVKLFLCAAESGARADFISGWLGTLDNFVDNQWQIDALTGLSNGGMRWTKNLDFGANLYKIANSLKFELDATATTFWAGSCHGFGITNLHSAIDNNLIQLVEVDTQNVDYKIIRWEYACKTYLTKQRTIQARMTSQEWIVDAQLTEKNIPISNQSRVDFVESTLRQHSVPIKYNLYKAKVLDYNKLFTAGGSRYLCDKLELDASDRNHAQWDAMLTLSNSPQSLRVWDFDWEMKNYF